MTRSGKSTISRNRIVAYSLLAHINDNAEGIADLSDIFVPLVQRALVALHREGVLRGQLSDLKRSVDKLYHFDIPFPVLRKILGQVARRVKAGKSGKLKVYKDDAFDTAGCEASFVGFEDTVRQQEAEIDEVNKLYDQYLRDNGADPASEPTLYAFLDYHRMQLSKYFVRREDVEVEANFTAPAMFVSSMKGNQAVFNTLRKIYLGSVIVSYLELDFGEVKGPQIELLLDTNFVVSALGLHSDESKHTCQKVLEIATKLGFKLSILDLTIDETSALLRRTAEGLETAFFTRSLNHEAIESACDKRGLTKTDLQRLASRVGERLMQKYRIDIVTLSEKFTARAEKNPVYKRIIKRKHNPDGAAHDALAVCYVLDKRHGSVRHFGSSKCWFVNDLKRQHRSSAKESGGLPEQVQAEYLVSVLWLTKPQPITKDLSTIGLTKLVAATINKAQPSPQVLHELDRNIQKYAKEDLSPEDLVAVANSTACKSAGSVEGMNALAGRSGEAFCRKLKEMAATGRREQAAREAKGRKAINSLTVQLEKKDKESQEIKAAAAEERMQHLRSSFQRLSKSVEQLENIRRPLEAKARRKTKLALAIPVFICLALVLTCYGLAMFFGWNTLEGWISFLNWIPVIFLVAYFVVKERTFDPRAVYRGAVKRRIEATFRKHGFDVAHHREVREEKLALEAQLSEETAGNSTEG